MADNEVFIISAVRTPIGSFGGVLKSLTATQLGAAAIKAAIAKANIKPEDIDEVLMGCVLQAGLGQAPARQAALRADLPYKVCCTTINKVCASGMKAIIQGAQSILLGDADIIVAGGMESMSNVPFYNKNLRWGNKYGNINMEDGLVTDGLTDAYDMVSMGKFADKCADECKISRFEQDEFAIASYKRSQKAFQDGKFTEEIVPVGIPQRNGDIHFIEKDEEPWNVKFEKIADLKPAFDTNGTVTAANASTINDGAAALVLVSKKKLLELGVQPLAKIVTYADAEQAPDWFTTTPSLALPKAAAKAGLQTTELDFVEINEAFSVVALANIQRMNLHPERVNIHGGAVSLGHPLGASGARIVVSLLHILRQYNGKLGGAAICNGGGGASALIIENMNY